MKIHIIKNILTYLRPRWFRIFVIFSFLIALSALLLSAFLGYVYSHEISRYTVINSMPRSLKKSIDMVRDIKYIPYKFVRSDLPKYKLYIDSEDYQKINDALPDSYDAILKDENKKKVPARFVHEGEEMDVLVNYRGDRSTHWIFEKKSWGIKFDKKNTFEGSSEIKLIVPHDRMYIGEYFNNYRAKKLGLPVPKDKLVIVTINDGPEMVYYQQDGWTQEFLRDQFDTDDGNLYGENDTSSWAFDSTVYWKKYVSIAGEDSNYADLAVLLDLIATADDEMFRDKIFTLVDKNNFYNWNIHSMLAGSIHQDGGHNLRLFFDKQQEKFYLIPWDVGIGPYESVLAIYGGDVIDLDVHYHPLVTRILEDTEFLTQRNRRLWEYVKDQKNLNEDLQFFDDTWNLIKSAIYNDKTNFYRDGSTDQQVARTRSNIIANYNYFHNQLSQAEMSAAISLQSNSRVPATLTFRYKSPSLLNLHDLHISSVSPYNGSPLYLYEDTDGDGTFGITDTKVSDLVYADKTISLDNTDIFLHTDRVDPGRYQAVSLDTTTQTFFVVSPVLTTFKQPDISFDIFNHLTNERLSPTVHINNSEAIFSSQ